MAEIARISSGAPWEPIFGYSRAVKVGPWMVVSGTTSFGENGIVLGRNQMYVQARQAIANIADALERAGMSLADVVRTRMFVTDMTRFAEVARAHLEAFGQNPPAATVVEVRRLINRDMMIEIEVDAYQAPAEMVIEESTIEIAEPAMDIAELAAEPVPAPAPSAKRPRARVVARKAVAARAKTVARPKVKTKGAAKTLKARPKTSVKAPHKPARKRR